MKVVLILLAGVAFMSCSITPDAIVASTGDDTNIVVDGNRVPQDGVVCRVVGENGVCEEYYSGDQVVDDIREAIDAIDGDSDYAEAERISNKLTYNRLQRTNARGFRALICATRGRIHDRMSALVQELVTHLKDNKEATDYLIGFYCFKLTNRELTMRYIHGSSNVDLETCLETGPQAYIDTVVGECSKEALQHLPTDRINKGLPKK